MSTKLQTHKYKCKCKLVTYTQALESVADLKQIALLVITLSPSPAGVGEWVVPGGRGWTPTFAIALFAAPAGVGAWVVPGGRRWTPNHTQTNRSIHCFATEEAIRGLRQAYVSQKKFDSQLPTHLGLAMPTLHCTQSTSAAMTSSGSSKVLPQA